MAESVIYRFALRTDKEFDKVKAFVTKKNMTGYAVREDPGDNEHYHWYLETSLKATSFRLMLTREVAELKGNKSYSLKTCDEDVEKYHRYCSKGAELGVGPDVAWRHGLIWSDEKFEELHQAYWEENQRIKKRKIGSVVDEVFERVKARGTAWDDARTIGREYLRVLYDRNKPINYFSIKSNIRLIQLRLCPDDTAFETLADQLFVS